MRAMIPAIAAVLFAAPLAAKDSPDLEMWRLDCGKIDLSDAASFSDAHLYDGEPRTLAVSCYLIRDGNKYLLWDTGLSSPLLGTSVSDGPFTVSLERTIIDHLAQLEISPADVTHVAASHYHLDHTGQLADFPAANLLIGAADWDVVNATAEPNQLVDPRPFALWLRAEPAAVTPIAHDHEVFGDGAVLIKAMPGYTPGHSSLLVRLPEKGDVLLTGDLYHFEEQVTHCGVPEFNTSRADTLASFERFNAMPKALDATVIIQYDPRHLDRLPALPESAK